MASRSLGTLSLDLIAKIGGFTGPLDKAGRDAKKKTDQMKKDFADLGKVVAGLGVAAAGGLAYMTTNLASSAKEIQNLSRLASASTDEFQKLTFGAERFGVGQEKVADILKDTQDKIGDFLNTGGGPLKDFFEQIAPKVGVTADQFRKLSGPDALQLYVKSLQDAGASQQDFTFYMEAIASDSTLLLPLLKDNGKALKELGEEAEKTGNVLSALDFAELQKITDSTDKLKAAFEGMGNQIVLAAIPAVNDLVKILSDQGTINAASALGNAVIITISAATKAIKGAIEVTQYLAESLAATFGGPALDDIVRVEDRIGELQKKIAGFREFRAGQGEFSQSLDDYFGLNKAGLERFQKWQDELKNLERARDAFYNKPAPKVFQDLVEPLSIDAPKPPSGGGGSLTNNKKELESTVYVYDDLLERIKEQIDLQKEAADQMARINSQAIDIADEFKSDEERLQESYDRRRQIVLDNTQVTGEARAKLLTDLESKLNDDLGQLNAGYWENYLAAAEENLQNFDLLAESVLNNFTGSFGNAFESIVFDSENLRDAFANLAEGMVRSVVNALGQMAAQWLAYQAVQLLVGKTAQASAGAVAVSNALIAQQMAAINAFAATAAIPVVGPALAPAASIAAIAATSPFVSAIAGLGVAGMAHEGMDSIPKTGTWLLEKGERVTTEKTSAKLDKTLSDIQKGGSGMGNISVINQTTGRVDKATPQRLSNGDIAIILQEVAASFGNPNSDISRSLSANTTASRSR